MTIVSVLFPPSLSEGYKCTVIMKFWEIIGFVLYLEYSLIGYCTIIASPEDKKELIKQYQQNMRELKGYKIIYPCETHENKSL